MKFRSYTERLCRRLAKKKKLLKRKALLFKVKIFFTCVLPVVVVLLAVKVMKTLVRIEIRKAAGAGKHGPAGTRKPVRQPIEQTSEKPAFITPEPVNSSCI